jgi:hypothetical protein
MNGVMIQNLPAKSLAIFPEVSTDDFIQTAPAFLGRRFCVKEEEHAQRGAPQDGVLPIAGE